MILEVLSNKELNAKTQGKAEKVVIYGFGLCVSDWLVGWFGGRDAVHGRLPAAAAAVAAAAA